MALTTRLKALANSALRPINLRVDTLTADRAERARLLALVQDGHFSRAVFPVPPAFRDADPEPLLAALRLHAERLDALARPDRNPVGFTMENDYYSSPDAEVLYCIVRDTRPRRVVEVGSGHSTRIVRLAMADGGMDTTLVAIDPQPRADVSALADVTAAVRVESAEGRARIGELGPGDILFIDSSHEIRAGNDVVALCLEVLPALPAGVLVCVDDIFLPYDYPEAWVVQAGWQWTEQYLVQALLGATARYEVLWAGHYFQRTLPGFGGHFPQMRHRVAKSLWMRIR